MAFDTFGAFIAMEGHGPYVWTCYAVFAVLLGGLMVWSLRQRRAVLAAQRREITRTTSDTQRPAAPASFSRINASQE